MYRIFKLLIISSLIISLHACSSSKKKEVAEKTVYTDEQLFDIATQNMDAEYYSSAKKYFVKLTSDYPYSKLAGKAQYLEAVTNYRLKDYDSAILAIEEYISLYPAGENIEDAFYLKAISYYNQILEVRLDQSFTTTALNAFRELFFRFPQGKYNQDAQLKVDLINDQLAAKDMSIGRFYLQKRNLTAAINRFQSVLEKFSTTSHIEEALYRLVESYMIMGINDQAVKYAAVLGKNYPKSEWYNKTYQLIKRK